MVSSSTTELVASLHLTPEERLLIVSARLHLDQDQRDELDSLLTGPLRWDEVLYKSQWHKLSALLYRHLRDQDNRERVPPEAMEQLKATYLANVASNLCFQSELGKVLVALRAQDIPVILLKGAALAQTVYADIGLRPMVDLDLLVRQEDAELAGTTIQDIGYRPAGNRQLQENGRADDRELAPLICIGKPVTVDVHWHVVEVDSPLRFDISGFWERAMEAPRAGAPELTLGTEDLITHLAINFLRDRRFRNHSALGQLCDIAEVVRSTEDRVDWNLVMSEAADANLRGPVFCGLYLAQQILDAPIPDRVIKELEPVNFRPKDLERFVRQRVLGYRSEVSALIAPGSPFAPSSMHHWWTIPLAILRRVFPGRQYMVSHYDVPVQSTRIYYLYLRRMIEALSISAKFATRSGGIRDDFAVDQWLHLLYGRQNNGKANPHD